MPCPKLTEVRSLDRYAPVFFRSDAKAVIFSGASSCEPSKGKIKLWIKGIVRGGVFDLKRELIVQVNTRATNLHLIRIADDRQRALCENL